MNGSSNTAKQTGTGFVNLQKMIGANKGNQLGSTIQQGVGNRVGQIQSDLGSKQTQFQVQLGQNQLKDTDKESAQGTLGTAMNAPKTLSNEQVSNFQGLLSGQYKGPSGLANTAGVEAQARELGQYGANVGSAAGRTNLLQRYVGGPKYTQGQQRVDNLLLGQTGGVQLKDVRKQALGLESQVTGAKSNAALAAQQAQQERAAYGKELEKQIGRYDDPSTPDIEGEGSLIGNIYKDLQDRTAKFNESQRALEAGLSGAGGQYQLTKAQLDELGISPGQTYHGLNLSNYINAAPYVDATIQQIAGEDDYAKYQALNRLAGRQGSLLTDTSTLNSAKEYSGLDTTRLKETLDLNRQAQTTAQNLLSQFESLLPKAMGNGTYADSTNAMRIYQTLTGRPLSSSQEFYSLMSNPAKVQELRDMVASGKSLENMSSGLDWLHTNANQTSEALVGDVALRDMVGGETSYENLLNYLRRLNPGSSSTLGLLGQNAGNQKRDGGMTSGDPLNSGGGKGNWGGGQ